MVLRWTNIWLLMLLCIGALHAQDEKAIRLSGDYYFGVGVRNEQQEAAADAVLDLSYRLYGDDRLELPLAALLHNKFSMPAIEWLHKVRSDGTRKSIAYFPRREYDRFLIRAEEAAVSIARKADAAAAIEGVCSAAPLYWKAWLLARALQSPVSYEHLPDGTVYLDVKTYLLARLTAALQEVSIQFGAPYQEDERLYVRAFPRCGSEPVGWIALAADGTAPRTPDEAGIHLPLEGDMSALHYEVHYRYYPTLPGGEGTPVMPPAELVFTGTESLPVGRFVEVEIGMEIRDDNTIRFYPEVSGIEVEASEWIFSDGVVSRDSVVFRQFPEEGEYLVILKVNNSDSLTAERKVNTVGRVTPSAGNETVKEAANIMPESDVTEDKTAVEIKSVIDKLLSYRDPDDMLAFLVEAKRNGELIYGRKSDFMKPADCYIIIIDTQLRNVRAIYGPANPVRMELFSKREFDSLPPLNMSEKALWLEVY